MRNCEHSALNCSADRPVCCVAGRWPAQLLPTRQSAIGSFAPLPRRFAPCLRSAQAIPFAGSSQQTSGLRYGWELNVEYRMLVGRALRARRLLPRSAGVMNIQSPAGTPAVPDSIGEQRSAP